MMYDWKNLETGEVIEHGHYSKPPKRPGNWQRVFSFGTGRVPGGAGSPARSSVPFKVVDVDSRKGEGEPQTVYIGDA